MKSVNHEETLWVEKYRPQVIEDCILPDRIMNVFKESVENKQITNMILSGTAGVGKTTVATALCKELDFDYIIINGSEERGLDMLRTTIANFASTVSLSGNGKCVVVDEFDHTLPATQAALRSAIEQYSKTCNFIFTCNYPNRIIEPLHSRCSHIKFEVTKAELELMQAKFFMRVCDILNNESIKYDDAVLVSVVQRFYPDCRKILNELQSYSRSGVVDEGIFSAIKEIKISEVVNHIKNRSFKDVRQWAADASTNETNGVYGELYRYFVTSKALQPSSIPVAIQILSDAQRYDTIVPDKELHLAAMCVSLMSELEWK